MVSADENAPIKGSGRNKKAEKAEKPSKKTVKRSKKSAKAGENRDQGFEAQGFEADALEAEALEAEGFEAQIPEAPIAIEAPVEVVAALRAKAANAPSPVAPVQTVQPTVRETVQDTKPINLQTITNAYGDYTKKSIEQTGSFIEQLASTRSLNSVFQLQNQFAMQAYETFVAESRRIRELHSEMTMQRLRSLEGFVAGMKPKR